MVTRPLWRDRNPLPLAEAIDGPGELSGEWDTLVVGGGLTGLATAALLARAGQRVVVAEARSLGAGTTGGSTAKASLLQGTRFSTIARRHTDGTLRAYAEANREGLAWLDHFCVEHGVDLQARPAYTYAHTPRGSATVRAELQALRDAGIENATWVQEPDLPFRTQGAVRLEDQRQLDPLALVHALAEDARQHGATVLEGVRVQRVRGRSPARVVAERGEATAATVVVATNMPILDRGGFFARAEPARSYSLAFRTPKQPVDGMYLSADSPSRSLRDVPADDGSVLLVGGAGHRTGAALSELARLAELRAWTHEHFPDAVETHAWSAQDYVTASGLPYVGPVLPGAEHLLVAGGFSKWGLTNGVAAALAIAGRVLGDRQGWASAYEPWDTVHLVPGIPGAVRANAEVGVEMAWGWVRPLLHVGGGDLAAGTAEVRYDHAGPPTATAHVDGEERAVSAVCTHLGGVLRWNDAERSWDCPLHGSRFDTDGAVLEGPATCGLRRVR